MIYCEPSYNHSFTFSMYVYVCTVLFLCIHPSIVIDKYATNVYRILTRDERQLLIVISKRQHQMHLNLK